MNTEFEIKRAKVIKKGAYRTGNGNNGPWARISVKVEWPYTFNTTEGPKELTQSAVMTFSAEQAVFVRDHVNAGNPFAQPAVPDTFLHIYFHQNGSLTEVQRKDGNGVFETIENVNFVDYVEIES